MPKLSKRDLEAIKEVVDNITIDDVLDITLKNKKDTGVIKELLDKGYNQKQIKEMIKQVLKEEENK